jgi:poly(3-hydroxybutyrate) depolymerase
MRGVIGWLAIGLVACVAGPVSSGKHRGGRGGRGGRDTVELPTKPYARPADPCAAVDAGSYLYTHRFNGVKVEVPLYIGASKGPRDLAVLLHGGRGSAPSILLKSRFHTKALAEGFVAAAPEATDLAGTGTRWNTGKFDKELQEMLGPNPDVRDDVAFLESLTRALRDDVCVDRVLAVGFSSGAQMANTWACQGKQADAVLSAAGALMVDGATCGAGKPVLGMVGTEDDIYRQSPNENDLSLPSAPETVAWWADKNHCGPKPAVTTIDDATCSTYRSCGQATQLCVIDGLPHAYPAPWGDESCTFNATDYGWSWFQNTGR